MTEAAMEERVRHVVLLPRFSAFSGAGLYHTAPLRARDFASASVSLWVGAGLGTDPTFEMSIEQSQDLRSWGPIGSDFEPTPPEEIQSTLSLTTEWIRLAITLGGTSPAFSCWAVADFVLRERR